MIKGIDSQVMTQRTVDFAREASVMMRRDELSNEFATRMNQATAKQESQSVIKKDNVEQVRVRSSTDEEPGEKGGGRQRRRGQNKRLPLYDEDGVPSVGQTAVEKLLDIEI